MRSLLHQPAAAANFVVMDRARRSPINTWPFGMLAALLLGGCSPASIVNLFVPTSGVEITHSVAYGDGPRRTLDIYRPTGAAAAPVIVFFYGGSWQSGSKELYAFLGVALARRGYLTVVPDYRIYPEVRYPDFLRDGAQAVRWAKDNAARFGGEPKELFVMGHSAGAHIASMLALDRRWLGEAGLASELDIAGLIGVSGPYDFLPLRDATLKTIFGGANQPDTQPITHVVSGAPPSLLLTGTSDSVVDPGNATRLAARLHASGDEASVVIYPHIGHITIMAAVAWPLRFLAPTLRDVTAFVAAQARRRAELPAVKP
jgi:acetyl esterase/lipase